MALLFALLLAASESLPVVAIDPGHGGEQIGAIGVCGVREKDVALAVSLELASLLEASQRVAAVLTRTDDRDVDLEERARIASGAGAILFVSVHANASANPESRGVETYFLSRRAADRRIADVVARENEATPWQGREGDDAVQRILSGLLLSSSHAESQRLALRLQDGMNDHLDTRGRGVLQAPFIVLMAAQVPAALVEVGFLTHAVECDQLADTAHQRSIAQTLAASILEHVANDRPAMAHR